MQETVTTATERKSLLSSFLDVLEAQSKAAQAERLLQEERYQRRTQRIYEYHDRQRREVVELRRCLDYVSQHAHVLETVLRGAGSAGGGEVPLSASLVRQAATLQRCISQCVANASQIRALLAATHQPQMDNVLAKMEAEQRSWTAFLHRAVDATYNSEIVIDNLHNMIEQAIDSNTLFVISQDDMKELIPTVGHRAMFIAHINALKDVIDVPATKESDDDVVILEPTPDNYKATESQVFSFSINETSFEDQTKLLDDFNCLYPDCSDRLYENWPLYRDRIIELGKKRIDPALGNIISSCDAEQRRYVQEVSSSSVFAALCGAEAEAEAAAGETPEAGAGAEADRTPRSPLERRPPSSCSTPIHN